MNAYRGSADLRCLRSRMRRLGGAGPRLEHSIECRKVIRVGCRYGAATISLPLIVDKACRTVRSKSSRKNVTEQSAKQKLAPPE